MVDKWLIDESWRTCDRRKASHPAACHLEAVVMTVVAAYLYRDGHRSARGVDRREGRLRATTRASSSGSASPTRPKRRCTRSPTCYDLHPLAVEDAHQGQPAAQDRRLRRPVVRRRPNGPPDGRPYRLWRNRHLRRPQPHHQRPPRIDPCPYGASRTAGEIAAPADAWASIICSTPSSTISSTATSR